MGSETDGGNSAKDNIEYASFHGALPRGRRSGDGSRRARVGPEIKFPSAAPRPVGGGKPAIIEISCVTENGYVNARHSAGPRGCVRRQNG